MFKEHISSPDQNKNHHSMDYDCKLPKKPLMSAYSVLRSTIFEYLREVRSVDELAPTAGHAGAARNGYCGY